MKSQGLTYKQIYFSGYRQRPLAIKSRCPSARLSVRSLRRRSKIRQWFAKVYNPVRSTFETRFDYYWSSVHGHQTTAMMSYPFILDRTNFLDVGCGTSQVIRRIARAICRRQQALDRNTDVHIFGLDISPSAIRVATEKWLKMQREYPVESVSLSADYYVGDAIDLGQVDLTRTCLGADKADVAFVSDLFNFFVSREEKISAIFGLRAKIKDKNAVPRRHLELVHEAIKLLSERRNLLHMSSRQAIIHHPPIDVDAEIGEIHQVLLELGSSIGLADIKKYYSLIFGLDPHVGYVFLIEPENPHFPPMAPFVSRQHADGLYPLVDTATPRHILYSIFEENGFYRLDFFDQTFQSMAGGIAFPPMTCSVFIPVK